MNQTFLSFTFKSDAPPFLLLETEQGAEITIEDGQSIAFDQIDDVIEALKAIKASIAKKRNQEGNGKSNGEDEDKDNGEEAISSGPILPPFNFNTPEKLNALVGRAVKLRSGDIGAVERVDLFNDCLTGEEEAICLDDGTWLYSNGQYWLTRKHTDFDMVEVLAK